MLLNFALFFVMGFFIEAVPIMLIFVPLMLPAARGLGIDPIHYGVTFSMIILLANLTPPVGVQTLFVCRLLDTTVFEWWRHGKYFFFVILLVTFVVMFVPEIPLWLPGAIMNGGATATADAQTAIDRRAEQRLPAGNSIRRTILKFGSRRDPNSAPASFRCDCRKAHCAGPPAFPAGRVPGRGVGVVGASGSCG